MKNELAAKEELDYLRATGKCPHRLLGRTVVAIGAVLVGMGTFTVRSASAQGVFDMGALTNTITQGAVVQSERERAGKIAGHKTSLKNALTYSANSSRTTQATFTPSADVRKRNIASFLSRVRSIDPQVADSLEREFAASDIFGNMAKKLAGYGLKTNSVTDAFTIYSLVAWAGVRGSNNDPAKTHVRGVRNQMAHVLANIPALTSASDAKKQEIADSFLLQALLIESIVEGAKKRPETMPQVKSALVTGTRATLGFDLTTFKLTEKGLSL